MPMLLNVGQIFCFTSPRNLDFWPKVDLSCVAASPLHISQGPAREDALAAQLFGGGTEPDIQGVLGDFCVADSRRKTRRVHPYILYMHEQIGFCWFNHIDSWYFFLTWWLWWALSWRSSPSFSLRRSAMTRRADLCRFSWGHDWRVSTKTKRANKFCTCESWWRWVFAFNMMELVIPEKQVLGRSISQANK